MACNEGGDDISLVSWSLFQAGAPANKQQWEKVQTEIRRAGGFSAVPEERKPDDESIRESLQRFLARAKRLDACSDRSLWEYLESRRIPRNAPAGYIDRSTPIPRYWKSGYPILVPAFTGRGALGSIAGRAITSKVPSKIWARGIESAGLVFADPKWARPWIRGGIAPDRLWITEGITDYLTVAASQPCIGVTSGSFDALKLMKERINDMTIFVAMHPDKAGERYEEKIAEALYPYTARKVFLNDGEAAYTRKK